VFLNSKKLLAKKTTTGVRYYKKIGLGKSSLLDRRPREPLTASHKSLSLEGRVFLNAQLCMRCPDLRQEIHIFLKIPLCTAEHMQETTGSPPPIVDFEKTYPHG